MASPQIEQVLRSYNEAIVDTDRNQALKIVHDAVDQGIAPEDIIFKIIIPSLGLMLKAVSESLDVNLAQHFIASRIAAEVTEEMVAKFKRPPETIGRIVIGTSFGDFHELGKKIVAGCLRAQMIEVIDLGANVPPERFVDEAVAHNAEVIGISSVMVHTALGNNGALKVRRILKKRGLEDVIKIIVGGAPYSFDPELYKRVEADAWAENGVAAVEVVKKLIQAVHPGVLK
jgi:methylmalonyl-CoA mutase cobalamin-binding domain/chain